MLKNVQLSYTALCISNFDTKLALHKNCKFKNTKLLKSIGVFFDSSPPLDIGPIEWHDIIVLTMLVGGGFAIITKLGKRIVHLSIGVKNSGWRCCPSPIVTLLVDFYDNHGSGRVLF